MGVEKEPMTWFPSGLMYSRAREKCSRSTVRRGKKVKEMCYRKSGLPKFAEVHRLEFGGRVAIVAHTLNMHFESRGFGQCVAGL